ncbi:NAD(P)-binding domain-containing protein [Microbacterium sp. NPDC019599]|uniref:NADPH-dependent F420 reductase n=1 Tax=Microbacterium sp. NPDC019599 TaxID=3154690 RepID=UPI003409B4A5
MIEVRPVIGILGAGRFGVVVARLAARAGYPVVVAASGDSTRVALPSDVLARGARPATAAEAAERAEIVILALPIGKHRAIPVAPLAGKIVIDAMNYWWESDGLLAGFTDPLVSSSEVVREHLPASRLVKALNHMSAKDLEQEARPSGRDGRKAIGIAADDEDARDVVARVVDDFGFDPVIVGRLADGVRLEPGTEPFGADVDAHELRAMIDGFPNSQRGRRRAAALAARGPLSDGG